MARRKCDSSQHSLSKRISNIENVLNINNSSSTPSSSTGEPGNDRSSNKTTRKRCPSADTDEGSKRRRSDGNLECTMCDKKYQVEWALIKHYKVYHREKSPGRLHKENLAKRALMKTCVNQPENDSKSPAKLHKENLAKKALMKTTNGNNAEEDNNCKLCEAAFNSTSARNSHYTSKHQIKDKELLFFPSGLALVESPLENAIKNNQEYFKTVLKRNMPSRVCKLCEIEFDQADLMSHYERDHKVIQISKVKILIRLNKTDIEKLCPSKKCNYCSDTFTDTDALEDHALTKHARDFSECQICKKTIEKKIYIDHVKNEHPDAKISEETEKQPVSKTVNATPVTCMPLMYVCDACNLVTSSYDNVIVHCQDHILNNVTIEPKLCEACDLKFDADFPIHEQMHISNDDLDRDSFRFISYDYNNLTNDKWLDMFDAFSKAKVNRITSASIYFSTRCIRLKLLKDCRDASDPFTLFKCLKCENHVHPKCVESHVRQQSACTNQTMSHECLKCKRIFHTSEAMDEHKETHNKADSDSKYRTVLFNDPKDFNFNKALLQNAGKSVLIEKVPIATSETKNANTEGVTDEGNKVASEHKMSNNAMNERVADVYKCACELCFVKFELLLMHMRNCSNSSTKPLKIPCTTCKLDFDRENFSYHCKAHENGITTFNVKKLILVDEMKIDASGTK